LTRREEADVSPTIDARELVTTDRCDRCGAQAYVRTVLPSGSELLFCRHHWFENEARLREVAVTIHDETERLSRPPADAVADRR
jgi:hypothetical protein